MVSLAKICESLSVPDRLHQSMQSYVYQSLRADFTETSTRPWEAFCRTSRANAAIFGPVLACPAGLALSQAWQPGFHLAIQAPVSAAGGLALISCTAAIVALAVGLRSSQPKNYLQDKHGIGQALRELGVAGLGEYAALRGAQVYRQRSGHSAAAAYALCMGTAIGLRAGLMPIRIMLDLALMTAYAFGGLSSGVIGAGVWGYRWLVQGQAQDPTQFFGTFGAYLQAKLTTSPDRTIDVLRLPIDFLTCHATKPERAMAEDYLRVQLHRFTVRYPGPRTAAEELDHFWQAMGRYDVATAAQSIDSFGSVQARGMRRALENITRLKHTSASARGNAIKLVELFLTPSGDVGRAAAPAVTESREQLLSLAKRRVMVTHPDKFVSIWPNLSDWQRESLAETHRLARVVREYLTDLDPRLFALAARWA